MCLVWDVWDAATTSLGVIRRRRRSIRADAEQDGDVSLDDEERDTGECYDHGDGAPRSGH